MPGQENVWTRISLVRIQSLVHARYCRSGQVTLKENMTLKKTVKGRIKQQTTAMLPESASVWKGYNDTAARCHCSYPSYASEQSVEVKTNFTKPNAVRNGQYCAPLPGRIFSARVCLPLQAGFVATVSVLHYDICINTFQKRKPCRTLIFNIFSVHILISGIATGFQVRFPTRDLNRIKWAIREMII